VPVLLAKDNPLKDAVVFFLLSVRWLVKLL